MKERKKNDDSSAKIYSGGRREKKTKEKEEKGINRLQRRREIKRSFCSHCKRKVGAKRFIFLSY